MALQAQRVEIADIQQARIGRAVRRVTGYAPLGLDHRMLEDKRACGFGVALGANGILIGSGFQLLAFEGAMSVVAIAAGHQALIHFVVEGLSEGRFYIGVTRVAKLRLGGLQEIGLAFESVRAMTGRAAYLRLA